VGTVNGVWNNSENVRPRPAWKPQTAARRHQHSDDISPIDMSESLKLHSPSLPLHDWQKECYLQLKHLSKQANSYFIIGKVKKNNQENAAGTTLATE